MEEVWKKIEGYEDYMVSNLGNVKNIKTEKILKPYLNNHNYLMITFTKDKISKVYLLHRLVAINFIANPENKGCVKHKDGNINNNKVDNLEWFEYSERVKNFPKRTGENNPNVKLNWDIVNEIRNSKLMNIELAKIYNIPKQYISLIKTNKKWKV